MKIINPKRLHRKLKKKIIKSWGRNTYVNLKRGHIFLSPYIIKETSTKIMFDDFNLTKGIITRYADKMVNSNFYGKIGCGEEELINVLKENKVNNERTA